MGNEQSRQLSEEERRTAVQKGEQLVKPLADHLDRLDSLYRYEEERKKKLEEAKRKVEDAEAEKARAAKTQQERAAWKRLAARQQRRREAAEQKAQQVATQQEKAASAKQLAAAEQQAKLEERFSRASIDADTLTGQRPSIQQSAVKRNDILASWKPRKEPKTRTNAHTPSATPDNKLLGSDGTARDPLIGGAASTVGSAGASSETCTSAKRPLSMASGRGGLSSLPRIAKKQRTSLSTSNSPQSPASSEGSGETQPPLWLEEYTSGKPSKLEGDTKSITASLKKEIGKVKTGAINVAESAPSVRDKLHKLFFLKVDEQTVRNNRLLTNVDGLPQIFDVKYASGVEWPFDIKADAKELYNKWWDRIFETDLLRDIEVGKPKESNKEGADQTGSSVLPGKRKSSKYVGEGKLLNGQWWPTLLCANRDGAHGEVVAGISGDSETGAYSCFISGGADNKYPDIDEGEVVYYCGTDDKKNEGNITRGTKMMLDAWENGQPIRFIRSSKAGIDGKSRYAPQCGFRYDGLYKIQDSELLDHSNQRHRFKLVRCPGQGPIRGGEGPEARPTKYEVDAYNKDRRLRGFK